MNCKPGDLAVIVHSATVENVGAVVRVLRPSCGNGLAAGTAYHECGTGWTKFTTEGFCWVVQTEGRPLLAVGGWQGLERPFGDQNLRPLRDPGDDAVDETLLRLPVPQKEGA